MAASRPTRLKAAILEGEYPPILFAGKGIAAVVSSIALVDDDKNILTSVAMALEAQGFQVRTYSDGAEALRGLAPPPTYPALPAINIPPLPAPHPLARLPNPAPI